MAGDDKRRIIDPVCEMEIDRYWAIGPRHYDGTEWWFCSYVCLADFDKDPERWALRRAPEATLLITSAGARTTRDG